MVTDTAMVMDTVTAMVTAMVTVMDTVMDTVIIPTTRKKKQNLRGKKCLNARNYR